MQRVKSNCGYEKEEADQVIAQVLILEVIPGQTKSFQSWPSHCTRHGSLMDWRSYLITDNICPHPIQLTWKLSKSLHTGPDSWINRGLSLNLIISSNPNLKNLTCPNKLRWSPRSSPIFLIGTQKSAPQQSKLQLSFKIYKLKLNHSHVLGQRADEENIEHGKIARNESNQITLTSNFGFAILANAVIAIIL